MPLSEINFLGIDLAWKLNPPLEKRTAIVVLNENRKIQRVEHVTTDEEILRVVEESASRNCLIGVDASLRVPPGLKIRFCEKMLASRYRHYRISAYPTNREWYFRVYGGVRGEELVKKLSSLGFVYTPQLSRRRKLRRILETYPYAALKILFEGNLPSYKKGKTEQRREALKVLISVLQKKLGLSPYVKNHDPWRKIYALSSLQLLQLADRIDALMAAYTAFLYWKEPSKCILLGDGEQGFIVVPEIFI